MTFAGCRSDAAGGEPARVELLAPGREVREASHRLGSFCPRLDRDLVDADVVDLGSPDPAGPPPAAPTRRAALRGETEPGSPIGLDASQEQSRVLVLSGSLGDALAWSELLGPGRVYALGGRAYSKASRDALRMRQRLLPLHEVDLKTATLSAVEESEGFPLWIWLHLDLLSASLAPGVAPLAPGGASLETVRAALEAVPGGRVMGFTIAGYPGPEDRNAFIALTAAELLRDNILTWWGDSKVL